MNFIFPQNYNFKNKFLGYIDYPTLVVNLAWIYFIYTITSLFSLSLQEKAPIIIIFCLPTFLFSILNIHNETAFQIISYLIKYILTPKLYVFYK